MDTNKKLVFLKMARIMTIVAWFTTIFGIGFFILIPATYFISIVLFSREKILRGILFFVLNNITFGIWGYIESNTQAHEIMENIELDIPKPKPAIASLIKNYKIAKIISIVAICIPIIGWFTIAALAGLATAIQEFRSERVISGLLLILFSALTLGIYPLIISWKRQKYYVMQQKQGTTF